MILSCNNISKAYGDEVILSGCSFGVEEKEKAAIVGVNGVGKTTLLKIIVKELEQDTGEVILSSGKKLGYLPQIPDIDSEKTIYDEVLESKRYVIDLESRIRDLESEMQDVSGKDLESKLAEYTRISHEFELLNGFAYKSEITGILRGLGFAEEEYEKKVCSLSGGQKTRLALGKLLLSKPDVILLDEPINHLDLNSIAWLETYLQNYNGAVIIVAHDRYFLDHVVTKVIEIDKGSTEVYKGNYSDYSKKKAEKIDAMVKAYINQQREIKHQEAVIEKLKSFNREKSIKRAESREKQLEKVEQLDRPVTETGKMSISLEPSVQSGKDVLSVRGLGKSYNNLELFNDLSFDITRGEKVAIIGDNGTGKTTILKIINGIEKDYKGKFVLGAKVKIGYYDQEHNILDASKTIFDEIHDAYPWLSNTRIRTMLASFLFTNDDVFKKNSDLSGGEKGRVSLAKLMLSEANLIILDEPTNHLDIHSKEILENALNNYTGTILYVSHDRYFINKTAGRILELNNKTLKNYIGNYDYFLEKKQEYELKKQEESTNSNFENIEDKASSDSKSDWKTMKEEQARQRKRQNDLIRTEEEIEQLELRSKELDELLLKEEIYKDASKLIDINNEKEEIVFKLTELYDKWEDLSI